MVQNTDSQSKENSRLNGYGPVTEKISSEEPERGRSGASRQVASSLYYNQIPSNSLSLGTGFLIQV